MLILTQSRSIHITGKWAAAEHGKFPSSVLLDSSWGPREFEQNEYIQREASSAKRIKIPSGTLG